MSQERSETTRAIESELQKARTLVDLVGHIDLANPPDQGTLVAAMSPAREAIDHARALLDWSEVRELLLLIEHFEGNRPANNYVPRPRPIVKIKSYPAAIRRWAHSLRALEINSRPLSVEMTFGRPCVRTHRSETATTRLPVGEKSASLGGSHASCDRLT
jgi:hypothetical protein